MRSACKRKIIGTIRHIPKGIGGCTCKKMPNSLSNDVKHVKGTRRSYANYSLNLVASPLPFAQWGSDLIGPMPRAPGNKKWLIVAMDYFTKWIEAEPLANIRDMDVRRFV